jgi:hypothetical protein
LTILGHALAKQQEHFHVWNVMRHLNTVESVRADTKAQTGLQHPP